MNKKLRSTATSKLGYTGMVKLSQYNNGKKTEVATMHNEGGKALFNFIAECLCGNFTVASKNMPIKILLLNVDDKGEKSAAEGTDWIYILTAPEKVYSETEGVVRYSFIIPQEYFAAGGSAVRFNAIGLYTKSATTPEDFAAYCRVKRSDWSLSLSSVLVLDWELHVANSFENDTEE